MSRARDLGSSINSTAAGKNYIINGGFDIWQRGTTFNSISNEAFGADRWFIITDNVGTCNLSRIDVSSQELGVRYAARIERSAGNNRTVYIHMAEGAMSLVGKQVTLSGYVRKGPSLTADIGVAFGTRVQRYGVESNGAGFTISNASLNTSTFTRFSRTLTITSATATNGADQFALEFSFSQNGSTGAYFDITGVQVEVGSVPTNFSRSGGDIQGELAKCQRYYETGFFGFQFDNSAKRFLRYEFKTTKRATPSLTVRDGLGNQDRISTKNAFYSSVTNNVSGYLIESIRTDGFNLGDNGNAANFGIEATFEAVCEL